MKLIKIFITASVLTISPALCSAGIMGDLNQLFMSNSTASGTFTTKDRAGVFGGSISMRAPVTAVNIVAFDPPRIDAGCGGIDLYGGSFSFINSQQLIQIFRSVAANAAGLAFKAAIKAISPSLDSLISEFQTLLQHMNNLGKNSCEFAHMIVNPAEQAISNAVNGDGSVGATKSGIFSDTFSSLQSYVSSANSFFPKSGEVNPKAGNQVSKALLASGTASIMGIAGISNIDGSTDDPTNPNSLNNEILISVLGYEISGIGCQKTNDAGTADTTTATGVPNVGTIQCKGEPLITLDDLVKGGGVGSTRPTTPLQLYKCVNPSGAGVPNGGFDPQICTQMQKINFNYYGVQGWVNQNLFGTADPSAFPTPTSILGLATSGQTYTLTAAQNQFLHQAGMNLIPLISRTSNPSERIAIAQRLSYHIVDCVSSRLGEALYKSLNGIQGANTYTLSNDITANIEKMRVEYLEKQKLCLKDRGFLELITEMNEAAKLKSANIH